MGARTLLSAGMVGVALFGLGCSKSQPETAPQAAAHPAADTTTAGAGAARDSTTAATAAPRDSAAAPGAAVDSAVTAPDSVKRDSM
ncbi:MAG TPA: hypothetical protein VGN76_01570 [Gemmatimonadales bacterium]|jgi:hypothetical protein|nr:hypothetical protein [Gemmatimonadales bacterium]